MVIKSNPYIHLNEAKKWNINLAYAREIHDAVYVSEILSWVYASDRKNEINWNAFEVKPVHRYEFMI